LTKPREFSLSSISSQVLRGAKELGFSDGQIGRIIGVSELAARKLRLEKKIRPFVKQIDTGIEFIFHL
jgi:carbamoyl-phosphate synthase/aspartate carbamoyltransferase